MLAESFLRSGKVRDLHMLNDGRLLLVASDRISAFDVVLPSMIPDKGRVLTGLSRFWFAETGRDRAQPPARHGPDGLRGLRRGRHPSQAATRRPTSARSTQLRGRMMICRPADVVPVEAVVRGYLAGSGWKEYQANAARSAGSRCPPGLRESDRLPEPIFTPATKAELGEHDENISFDRMIEHIAAGLLGDARLRRPAGRGHPRPGAPALWLSRRPSPSGAASCSPTRNSSSAWHEALGAPEGSDTGRTPSATTTRRTAATT